MYVISFKMLLFKSKAFGLLSQSLVLHPPSAALSADAEARSPSG